jgi:hypothetical protein
MFYNLGADDSTFTPELVELTPDPPRRGEDLVVFVKGMLSKPIVNGAKAHVKVQIG